MAPCTLSAAFHRDSPTPSRGPLQDQLLHVPLLPARLECGPGARASSSGGGRGQPSQRGGGLCSRDGCHNGRSLRRRGRSSSVGSAAGDRGAVESFVCGTAPRAMAGRRGAARGHARPMGVLRGGASASAPSDGARAVRATSGAEQ